jgi:hypothetical protein
MDVRWGVRVPWELLVAVVKRTDWHNRASGQCEITRTHQNLKGLAASLVFCLVQWE